MAIIIDTLDDFEKFGKKIASRLKPRDILTLTGEVGVGKTTLSKIIGKEIGIVDDITSPTYAILKIYHSKIDFYHFDFYRLDRPDYSLEEYLYNDGITIIEWPSNCIEMIPEDVIEILIEVINNKRVISISKSGKEFFI